MFFFKVVHAIIEYLTILGYHRACMISHGFRISPKQLSRKYLNLHCSGANIKSKNSCMGSILKLKNEHIKALTFPTWSVFQLFTQSLFIIKNNNK